MSGFRNFLKASIVRPQMVGGDRFHIGKDLNGDYIFRINDTAMKMGPAQAHDLACRLLKSLGIEIEVVERPVAPGPTLAP